MKIMNMGLLLFLLLAGCGWGGGKTDEKITLTLTTDKNIYRATEPIAMSLVVRHQGEHPEKFTFSSSKEYDFILTSGPRTVWKWSGGKMFAQALRAITLEPGKPLVYRAVFNPAVTGQIIEEGEYRLTGVWTPMGRTISSSPVTVKIHK